MTSITLSPEQAYAFELFKQGKNIFITGPGGTGKSQLIKTIVNYCEMRYPKKYQVCAMTGCAALLLKMGARTIHSWSGMRLARGTKDQIITSIYKNKKACANWKKVQVLIIDEVSMMSQKIFEVLEETARSVRKRYISPFGGIQVVFCGDFFQLPPVGNIMEPETMNFCFQSPKWPVVFPINNIIQLKHIFRQKDETYIKILNEIRYGNISDENVKILNNYVNRKYDQTNGIVPPKLFPIKAKVECYNRSMFDKIEDGHKEYKCICRTNVTAYLDSGIAIDPEILALAKGMSAEEKAREIQYLIDNNPINECLELKIGAVVMCTANLDLDSGICNGSLGVIKTYTDAGVPIVKFNNGVELTMELHHWQHNELPFLAVSQYPLMLAWAMTIHKIQGATLPMAEIDIGKTVFEYGQVYVALSRIQSLDGLYLFGFNPLKIKANPEVVAFYKFLPEYSNDYYNKKIDEMKQVSYQKDMSASGDLNYEEYNNTIKNNMKSISGGVKKLDLSAYEFREDCVKPPAPPVEKYNDNCVVCMTNKKNMLLRPCNHLCLCTSCDNSTIKICPMCRMTIEDKVKVLV